MNIHKSTQEMPSPDNIEREVVRTALTMRDHILHNHVPTLIPSDNSVQHVQRPRRGHGY